MNKLEVMDKETDSNDMSYWEEQQSIAAAEKHLTEGFRENKENCQQATNDPENPNTRSTIVIQDEGNSSLKEDELPGRPNFLNPQLVYTEDGNETDTFLNYKYSKMMNT